MFFLASRILELSIDFNHISLQTNWSICISKQLEDNKIHCENLTGGYLNVFVSIFNVNNTIFSLVVLFSKSVEDYIASFSQHDTLRIVSIH